MEKYKLSCNQNMDKKIGIIIVEKHDKLLDIIKEPINTLVNFDWHADYPRYAEEIIDVEYFVKQIDPVYYEHNFAAVLAKRCLTNKYLWIFPHNFSEENIKFLRSAYCKVIAYNRKFNKEMKITEEFITIDMDFFGSRIPIQWEPPNRTELLKNLLNTLVSNNILLIISKSKSYANYDVDKFLQEILLEISNRFDIDYIG